MSTAPAVAAPRSAEGRGRAATLLIVAAVGCLVWLVAARIAGPSDLWDQTQPKTVSYTTDIIVHGRWMLPLERGVTPATKPPLYNWLATPFVKTLGFSSEIGHKLPSLLALCACFVLVVRLGNRLDGSNVQATGWMAAVALIANYAMFKLGFLARPDMVLVMWMSFAWASVTALLVRRATTGAPGPGEGRLLLAFWLCTGLAGLTKGPPAVILPLYAIIAGRAICGSWRGGLRLGWWWGLPLALAMVGAWVAAVWRIDAGHLYQVLWHDEIWGRVTGTGPEGNTDGPIGWLTDFPNMLLYYLVRFGPWSLAAIVAMYALWKGAAASHRRERSWLIGAALFAGLTVAVFTLSTGKRADYLAPAYVPSAVLAGWWLVHAARVATRFRGAVPAVAAVVMVLLTVDNQMDSAAPDPRFSDEIETFIERVSVRLEQQPDPLVVCWAGATHVQAMLGHSRPGGERAFRHAVEAGRPFWLIAGRASSEPAEFERWVERRALPARLEPIERTARLPRRYAWPEQMTLYRVEPSGPGRGG